jgi:serine/threonine-protein kinase
MGTAIDGRADIYATGCLAYWFLTGQLVFTGETPMALLMHHAKTPPAPPSTRIDRRIPRAMDDLVLSCLAKEPANRPQSARELSLRLAELDGASAWTQDRAKSWWETHLGSSRT